MTSPAPRATDAPLARRIGAFDATMLVMGGIVGAGIFINPHVVATRVDSPALAIGAWLLGGLVALAGAFVYAELAVWRPESGGVYAYLRDAFHPVVAFLYGWTLLLVVQTGGMAAVAVTFAVYLRELVALPLSVPAVAVTTLAVLTAVNLLGVSAGSRLQSVLMVAKLGVLALLVTVGWLGLGAAAGEPAAPGTGRPAPLALMAALVPVLFAYGGWQTASFVSGEMRDPRRDLPRALVIGVLGVVALYVLVNAVALAVLGLGGLAATEAPASEVMRRALGPAGARFVAAGIAVSTVGFLSQGMLTAPRVYYAMARDGLFFRAVGRVSAGTRVPAVAIALQGAWAAVIALSGRYEQILGYVVAIDALFFGLAGAALLVFRRREGRGGERLAEGALRMPGHPVTTAAFVLAFWLLALSTVLQFPRSAGIGVLILLAGLPAYALWRRVGTPTLETGERTTS